MSPPNMPLWRKHYFECLFTLQEFPTFLLVHVVSVGNTKENGTAMVSLEHSKCPITGKQRQLIP